ncbi:MAG: DUF116 domain-containing protein [Clostridiaceae bacterium]|nr:DUF116 domain-containing protein [Clostridiaceae bacterium]
MENNRYFYRLSFLIIAVFLFLTAFLFFTASFLSLHTYRIIIYITAFLLLTAVILLLTGFIWITKILSQRDNNSAKTAKNPFLSKLSFRFFMPLLLAASEQLNFCKDEIRRVYINTFNEYIKTRKIKETPDKMLVILPHCLQNSKCPVRFVDSIDTCAGCNSCSIGAIKELLKKYGIRSRIATGGTAARKIINDEKPGFVIAVACERDLSSGMMDVQNLPVYGILNKRPNGPCRDTFVNTDELEYAILLFCQN